jgi:pimeloyl-ACP methyl ester carboxylesterase
VPNPRVVSCLVNAHGAQLYCETAGKGKPFIMIHAGVADRRQWNNEFKHFARTYKVVRYDMRGYGKSEPADGGFNHMLDLAAVLDALEIREPVVMMGCSMGGGLALDFALEHPASMRALIMVGSGPSGLDLNVPESPKHALAEKAWKEGDVDLTAELETQLWFDGEGRTPQQVDPEMRKLAFDMDRQALRHEARNLGKRQPNSSKPAFDRLEQLIVPVLIIVGAQDQPYAHASADYMMKHIPSTRMVTIEDAAHLANMDHPAEFCTVVEEFLKDLPG